MKNLKTYLTERLRDKLSKSSKSQYDKYIDKYVSENFADHLDEKMSYDDLQHNNLVGITMMEMPLKSGSGNHYYDLEAPIYENDLTIEVIIDDDGDLFDDTGLEKPKYNENLTIRENLDNTLFLLHDDLEYYIKENY